MSNYNYYNEQLDKLEFSQNTNVIIKLRTEYPSSETKHMRISKDNVDLFIKFLEDLKNRIS